MVFDELKQSVRDVEFLSDPGTGHLTIGAPESIGGTVLPRIVERFLQQYPRVILDVEGVASPAIKSPGLRDRRYDLVIARWHDVDTPVDDLDMEPLFDDPFVIAAGPETRWARRRKFDLAEIADEHWILPPLGTWNYEWVAREFRTRGFGEPKVAMTTFIGQLNAHFVRHGRYLTVHPRSWALHNGLVVVPVDVPLVPIPVSIVTLKNRTLSPVAEKFADCAREVARAFQKRAALTR